MSVNNSIETNSIAQNIVYRKYNFPCDFPLLHMEENYPSFKIENYHFHNCIEIAYSLKGSKKFVVENQSLELTEGCACFIPPFHMHASYGSELCENGISFKYLFFNTEDLLAPFFPQGIPQELLWFKCDNSPYFLTPSSSPTELFLLGEIFSLLDKSNSFETHMAVCGMIKALLVHLSRRYSHESSTTSTGYLRESLMPALAWLRNHYEEKPNIAALAKLCNMPVSQFSRNFKAALSNSPENYVKLLRIQQACEQMIETEQSILDIALSVGFESSSSFYYNFKAITGTNPNSWRKTRLSFHKKEFTTSTYKMD